MLHKAVLLLLFAVTGSPTGETSTAAHSALAVASAPLRAELTLGAWQGTLVDAAGARRPVEVSVADGIRRDTVFGYFMLPTNGRETTVRRLGRIEGDDLVFDLRDGGRVALRLLSGRLVGDVVDPAGQIVTGRGTLELGRLRP
jgi:hypothetical protein